MLVRKLMTLCHLSVLLIISAAVFIEVQLEVSEKNTVEHSVLHS